MSSWSDWGSVVLGGASLYNSYNQGKAAQSAANTSNQIAKQQMDYGQQDRQHYAAIYGDLEKTLSDYYNKLTPSKREQLGLSRYDTQFKTAQDNYKKSMAQRGLSGSGIAAEGDLQMNMQAAKDRTNIINQADTQTRSDQLGFLGVGLGQSNIVTQNAANAATNAQSSYNNASNMYAQQAANSGKAFANISGLAGYASGKTNHSIFDTVGSIF